MLLHLLGLLDRDVCELLFESRLSVSLVISLLCFFVSLGLSEGSLVLLHQFLDFFEVFLRLFAFLAVLGSFLLEASGQLIQGSVLHNGANSLVLRLSLAHLFGGIDQEVV